LAKCGKQEKNVVLCCINLTVSEEQSFHIDQTRSYARNHQ